MTGEGAVRCWRDSDGVCCGGPGVRVAHYTCLLEMVAAATVSRIILDLL